MTTKILLQWILRLVAAAIMLQTLHFKFGGLEESKRLFSALGMEPWGRIGTGVVELIAAILILIPRTTIFGAGLGMGVMSGAIFFHLTVLGISYEGSSYLFVNAVIGWIACAILLLLNMQEIKNLLSRKKHAHA
jgi:uncharacterized membrane protein YphA (DoxX/SURF4 family)